MKRHRIYTGDVVDLREMEHHNTSVWQSYPSVDFQILLHENGAVIGECDLRIGESDELFYAGNIGYRIYEHYRGNGYAYKACLLLFDIARKKQMDRLYITCTPENIASKKTIEKLDGCLFEGVYDVPEDHWLYQRGEKVKNVYRFEL